MSKGTLGKSQNDTRNGTVFVSNPAWRMETSRFVKTPEALCSDQGTIGDETIAGGCLQDAVPRWWEEYQNAALSCAHHLLPSCKGTCGVRRTPATPPPIQRTPGAGRVPLSQSPPLSFASRRHRNLPAWTPTPTKDEEANADEAMASTGFG